ncbi:hypothetical protein [Bacillus sp. OAE603]|uniref:hypothetical protein n=1 Tax=Gottfriedia sp. OAE603 TaxID=2663872 RepID=UPI00178A80D2
MNLQLNSINTNLLIVNPLTGGELNSNDIKIEERDFTQDISVFEKLLNNLAPQGIDSLMLYLSILFVLSLLVMCFAIITKNGQWTKTSTNWLKGSFITLLTIKIVPLLVFTMTVNGIKPFLNDTVGFIQMVGYYTAIGMILAGMFIHLLYMLIDHPEYQRWSKRLVMFAILLTFFSEVGTIFFKFT